MVPLRYDHQKAGEAEVSPMGGRYGDGLTSTSPENLATIFYGFRPAAAMIQLSASSLEPLVKKEQPMFSETCILVDIFFGAFQKLIVCATGPAF